MKIEDLEKQLEELKNDSAVRLARHTIIVPENIDEFKSSADWNILFYKAGFMSLMPTVLKLADELSRLDEPAARKIISELK